MPAIRLGKGWKISSFCRVSQQINLYYTVSDRRIVLTIESQSLTYSVKFRIRSERIRRLVRFLVRKDFGIELILYKKLLSTKVRKILNQKIYKEIRKFILSVLIEDFKATDKKYKKIFLNLIRRDKDLHLDVLKSVIKHLRGD